MKETRILILNVLGSGNKGDLAILESEIQELKRILDNVEISVWAYFPEGLNILEPKVNVFRSPVDMPIAWGGSKMRNTHDRASGRYLFHTFLLSWIMLLQCFALLVCAILMKLHCKPFYRSIVLESLKKADLLVFNGGEGFKEGSVFLPKNTFSRQKIGWWMFLFQKFWIVIVATKILKKPLLVLPNSVGPTQTVIGRYLIKAMIRCSDIFMVRDSSSILMLQRMGLEHFIPTGDIALLLRDNPMNHCDVHSSRLVGVSPGLFDLRFDQNLRQKYVLAHAKALDYLIGQEGFNVVFLPSNLRSEIGCNDLDISRMIIQNMLYGGRVKIVNVSDAREFRAVSKQLDLLISTRMHPTILASLENVPFVSIIYDHKQLGFLDQIGLESCGINVDEISCEKLLSKFRFVLSNKDKIKKQMNSRVLILRKDIRNKTEKCVLTLLRRKSARSSISRRFRG